MDTKTMVSIAMLTGIAYIVMLLSKLMPSVMFLDFDFKDVVVCIGGFTFGPFAAAIISILVAFIEMLTISHTGPIGFITVSYTHLDVYKRQSICFGNAFRSMKRSMERSPKRIWRTPLSSPPDLRPPPGLSLIHI